MIEKTITCDFDNPDNFYCFIDNDKSLIKTASSVDKEISDFIANLEIDTAKYVYVLINTLGAQEYYGSNNNGDGFPEYYEGKPNLIHDGPAYGYKTFETNGNLFKHHQNKDPKKRFGEILLAVYNHAMHRPEIIVRIDRSKAPADAKKVDNGEVVSTSMGAKVPFDVCSICGNKAKTRANYCSHLKYSMNKVLPDGRKVFAINPYPRFFDISLVFKPADATSRVMKKLASDQSGEKVVTAEVKSAEIEKEITGPPPTETKIDRIIDKLISKRFSKVDKLEPEMSPEQIGHLTRFPLRSILSTLAFSGIIPKPREFQKIVMIKMNKEPESRMLDKQNLVFNRFQCGNEKDVASMGFISSKNIIPEMFDGMQDIVGNRSRWQPHLLSRLLKGNVCTECGRPTEMNATKIQAAISSLYRAYMKAIPSAVLGSVKFEKKAKNTEGQYGKIALVENYINSRIEKYANTSKNVDIIGNGKLYSLYDNIYNTVVSDGNIIKAASNGIIGLPILSIISENNMNRFGSMLSSEECGQEKVASQENAEILSLLTGFDSSDIMKTASDSNVMDNVNSDTVKLLHESGSWLDVITLAKIMDL